MTSSSPEAATSPAIRAFFDEPTSTVSYLVSDPATGRAAVIDPLLDFDLASGEADVRSALAILDAASEGGLAIDWVLETHAHADHLSAAPFIKAKTGARIGIGERIKDVQKIFRPMFQADDLRTDGSDFDHLFADGERFAIGALEVEVIAVPGHTPADVAYRVGDAVFVGDTLFMPDYGTARTDFPGAMRASSIARSAACSRFPPRRGCSCAMTTRHPAATITRGKPPSRGSAPPRSTSATG